VSLTRVETIKNWFREHIRIPLGVVIAICIFPVILTALFYVLRSSRATMDWVVTYISSPIRSFFGLLSSIYPFAVMEILITVAIIFLIYYIIKGIRDTSRRREKWKLRAKRFLPILVIACYLWGMFSWLWSSGYYATGFVERYELFSDGVSREELFAAALMFASKANDLSEQVERDSDGNYDVDRRVMFTESVDVYRNISQDFPSLYGRLYAPKPMLFSWLMSITGYSGMYFALTGESMVNTQPPVVFMPATVAHEHAHQLGIFAEDEANLVAILACIKSDNITFQYAGYMSGLNYLLNALYRNDDPTSNRPSNEWIQVVVRLSENVLRDRQETEQFWATRTTVRTGLNFLDRILTTVAETTYDAVNAIYDGYLKSQSQELGIRSYGAFVDVLVGYFTEEARAFLPVEQAQAAS